jgi:hypothetical protein
MTPLDVDELDRILLEMMNPIDYKNTLFSICGKKHPQPVYSPNNVKTAKQALLTYIKEEQAQLTTDSRVKECYLTIAELNQLGVMTPEAYGYFDKRVAELKQRNRLEQS